MLRRSILLSGVAMLSTTALANPGRLRMGRGGAGGGGATPVTETLKTLGKKLLAYGASLTALNGIPAGNAVTLTQSGGSPVESTYGALYVADSAIVPAPSAAWTGAAGTGYTSWTEDGNARTMTPDKNTAEGNGTDALGNEPRLTAKPALVMMSVPLQRFTGKHKVYLASDAASPITKVRVYLEGAVLDLTSRKWDRYTDAKGVEQWFYGYICEIDAALYTAVATDPTRVTRMFARSYCSDGTMQTQLIGIGTGWYNQLLYYPCTLEHDYLIHVTPSGGDSKPAAAFPGVYAIFNTLEKAIRYAANENTSGLGATPTLARCPKIVVTETTVQDPANGGNAYQSGGGAGGGLCVVTCDPGVTCTIGRAVWNSAIVSGIPANQWRPVYNGIEYRGRGIIWDYTNLTGFSLQANNPGSWMNGNRTTQAWTAGTQLDNQGFPRVWGGNAYQTDNENVSSVATFIALARNNTRAGILSDGYTNTTAVWGDVIDGWDTQIHRVARDAISVIYSGPAGTANLVKAGGNGNAGSTFKMTFNGVDVAAPMALNVDSTLQGVVNYINAQSGAGWSATLLATPGDRVTSRNPSFMVSTAGFAQAGWTATLTSGVAYVPKTFCDIHADLYAFGSTLSNRYVANVRAYRVTALQSVFVDGAANDVVFSDIFIEQTDTGGTLCQINGTAKSHLVIRNFSVAAQGLTIRNEGTWSADPYCRLEGCVFSNMIWLNPATATVRPVFTNNHAVGGYTNQGAQVAVNMSTGGTAASLYPNVGAKDSRPGGLLLDAGNLITSTSDVDARGARRIGTTPKGATTIPLANGVITKDQALQLAALTEHDTVGSAVGTATLSWKAGAGETGLTNNLVITFNVPA